MSEQRRPLFRTEAIDRLASPESLEQMVRVVRLPQWLALATVGVLFAALLVWAFLGAVPVHVYAEGILISRGGAVADAQATADGVLDHMLVAVGAEVKVGQQLASIRQEAAADQLANQKELVRERESGLSELEDLFAREQELKRGSTDKRRKMFNEQIAAAGERITYLQRTLNLQEKSAKEGYVTQRAVEESRVELNTARQERAAARSELLALDAGMLELESDHARQLTQARQTLTEARRELAELERTVARTTAVTAPINGRVTEIKVGAGAVVARGQALLSVERAGEGLETVLYLPTLHGKKVRPGMRVRVTPDTVRAEEFGSLVGEVRSVSDFPVSPEGMASVLPNQTLVEQFSASGAPYESRVRLFSEGVGYRWTSGDGPPAGVSSGTTVKAEITLRDQRPIELVLPVMRAWLGDAGE
ncbi:MAG: NHLP bacteriocin system secretion protein [Chromatiaceae bacterium]|nr:NHLP bacteriocin system secretion protein [Chromatiaceae bacterium]